MGVTGACLAVLVGQLLALASAQVCNPAKTSPIASAYTTRGVYARYYYNLQWNGPPILPNGLNMSHLRLSRFEERADISRSSDSVASAPFNVSGLGNIAPTFVSAGIIASKSVLQYTGRVVVPCSGAWQFMVRSDDGVAMYWAPDGKNYSLAHLDWTAHGTREQTLPSVTLTENTLIPFNFTVYQAFGGWVAQFLWKPPGAAAFTVVPTSNLLRGLPYEILTVPSAFNLTPFTGPQRVCVYLSDPPLSTVRVDIDSSLVSDVIGFDKCFLTFDAKDFDQPHCLTAGYKTTSGSSRIIAGPVNIMLLSSSPQMEYNNRVGLMQVYTQGGSGVTLPSPTMCTAHGDPHYLTFDKGRFDFYLVGYYNLMRDCSGDIAVQTRVEMCGPDARVSCNQVVYVKWKDALITLYMDGANATSNAIYYIKSGTDRPDMAIVPTALGWKISSPMFEVFVLIGRYRTWRYLNVDIAVSGALKSSVVGLCGNFNGNPTDDVADQVTLGKRHLVPPSEQLATRGYILPPLMAPCGVSNTTLVTTSTVLPVVIPINFTLAGPCSGTGPPPPVQDPPRINPPIPDPLPVGNYTPLPEVVVIPQEYVDRCRTLLSGCTSLTKDVVDAFVKSCALDAYAMGQLPDPIKDSQLGNALNNLCERQQDINNCALCALCASGQICTNGTCTTPACSGPCLNGGSCVSGKCACVATYTGELCDIPPPIKYDQPRCLDNSCAVQATCREVPGFINCTCNKGYTGDPKTQCTDINECTGPSTACTKNSVCLNTPGSYSCGCAPGYVGDGITSCTSVCLVENPCEKIATCTNDKSTGLPICLCPLGLSDRGDHICVDVDECKDSSRCSKQATCQNSYGSFSCVCTDGYKADSNTTCADIDECKDGFQGYPACPHTAKCTNSVGSFSCACLPGYEGDGSTCSDVNECMNSSVCNAQATCSNNVGSFSCACQVGYSGDGISTCADINECAASGVNSCSANGSCTNNMGSFTCACLPKYVGDGQVCSPAPVPINLCLTEPPPCGINTICLNRETTVTCECNPGFTGDAYKECLDLNECEASPGPCHSNATCSNIEPGFACVCNEGFEGDGSSCTDVNECQLDDSKCNHGTCMNAIGSYTCQCSAGYVLNERGLCEDLNECSMDPPPCNTSTSLCENTDGSYQCACVPGFESLNGASCSDMDECAKTPSSCGDPAKTSCSNIYGSFTCSCRVGYTGTSPNCVDFDECSQNDNPCGARASCTNNAGSFICACSEGFTGVAPDCPNINECNLNAKICGDNSLCQDTVGSFLCPCNPGFTGTPGNCQNFDECVVLGSALCHQNSTCVDSIGSFDCICFKGFNARNGECFDVNECDNSNACSSDAQCVNVPGSMQCTCNNGYTGNGITCTDTDECLTQSCGSHALCANTVGSFACQCLAGYGGTPPFCDNINECVGRDSPCGYNADCTDTDGSFRCQCSDGYQGDAQGCFDVNECESATPPTCTPNAKCNNTIGSFSCLCEDGYSENGTSCIDNDECERSVCDTSPKATCKNTPGSFQCTCSPGYVGDGVTCHDIDECSTKPCDTSATCLNSGGSYSCLCNVGYSGTGLVCEDVNECGTDQPCAAPGVCANCPGSFHCVCPVGYLFDTLGVCQDINECIHPTVCMGNSTCSNVNGSFSCACLPGYINQGSECVPDPDAPIDPRTNPCTPDPCHVHASCSANSTGYTCKCDAGYIGNGTVCTNEDECKKENTCANSVCVDTKGSYVCQCYDYSFVQPCPSEDICTAFQTTATLDQATASSCHLVNISLSFSPMAKVSSLNCAVDLPGLDFAQLSLPASSPPVQLLSPSGTALPMVAAPQRFKVLSSFNISIDSLSQNLTLVISASVPSNLGAGMTSAGRVTCEWTSASSQPCRANQPIPQVAIEQVKINAYLSPKEAFGPATLYSLVTLNNFNATGETVVSGRMAVGGTLTGPKLTVGHDIGPVTCGEDGGAVVVGEAALWDVGTLASGALVVGNMADSQVDAAVVGGTCGVKHVLTSSPAFPLNFTHTATILKDISATLAALAPTGTQITVNGGMALYASGQVDLEVIALDGSTLSTIGAIFGPEGLSPTATLVLNIAGVNNILIRCTAMEGLSLLASRLIWNFFEAQSFSIAGGCQTIPGVILAPYGSLIDTSGTINGSVYVQQYVGAATINSPPTQVQTPCGGAMNCCGL